jgi:hypothetical protein
MSSDGALNRSVRSCACWALTMAAMSIRPAPALLTMSGGSPALIRGWTTLPISVVSENATLASGNSLLYDGTWTSVAYLVPSPPLKMMISSGAFASTPSGLVLDLSPSACSCGSSEPPPTQPLSMPTAGVASRPTAAARRSSVRRSSSDFANTSVIVVSSRVVMAAISP